MNNRLQFIIQVSIILSLGLVLCMCSIKNSYTVDNTGIAATDSTMLHCEDTITVKIGNRIKPIPSSSQIIESDSSVKYVIMDENTLYVYDLSNDSVIANIDIKKFGNFNNYSGFAFLNNDTIFVYNYKNKMCILTDAKGMTLNSQPLSKEIIKTVSPEALSCTPALSIGERVYLSGKPICHTAIDKDEPISLYWDFKNHKINTGASFPYDYSKGYFGGVYYNTIYQCKSDKNMITYSFPVSNHIYRYDYNLELVDSLYMGSRYTRSIVSENGNIKDFLSDKDERLKYFLEQDSYEQIFYNDKEKLYFRIAEHPLVTSDNGNLRKPFSIIVMDNNGNLITETPVLNNDRSLITPNAHVYKNGIIIQIETEDENIIKFAYFKIR